jgi:hypothetical protein
MKRLITALGLSAVALSASALEVGKPYEQLDVDRALPNINIPASNMQFAESENAGTRIDAYGHVESPESPFANDWNFIAPAP